jgi:predicted Co/Zn/Cd cation transporter (cation efflux family)
MGDFVVFCAALTMTVLCASELGGAARKRGRRKELFAVLPIVIVMLSALLVMVALSETRYAIYSLDKNPLLALVSIFLVAFALSQILYMVGVIETNPPTALMAALLAAFALAEIVYALGIIETDPLVIVEIPFQRIRELMP